MKNLLWIGLAVALVVYAAFVVAYNGDHVPLNLLFIELDAVPVWQLLLTSTLFGGVVTALLVVVPLVRLRLRVRRQGREVARLEQEVHGLRTLPITDATDAPEASRSANEV